MLLRGKQAQVSIFSATLLFLGLPLFSASKHATKQPFFSLELPGIYHTNSLYGLIQRDVVVHVTKEASGIAALGGMAQMVGGLVRSQAASGTKEVFVMLPLYGFLQFPESKTFRVQHVSASGTTSARVHMVSTPVHSADTSEALGARTAEERRSDTSKCIVGTMAGALLGGMQASEWITDVQRLFEAFDGEAHERCVHFLLVDAPSHIPDLWQHIQEPHQLYQLPLGVTYSQRDAFFGSAAAMLAAALQNSSEQLLELRSGIRPKVPHSTQDLENQSIQKFVPLSMATAVSARFSKLRHMRGPRGSGAQGSVDAHLHEAYFLSESTKLHKCASIFLHVHGATNSAAVWLADMLGQSGHCKIAAVYTMHDFSWEQVVQFQPQDLLQFLPVGGFAQLRLPLFDGKVVALLLGLSEAGASTTVSDTLAQQMHYHPGAPQQDVESEVFTAIGKLAVNGQWFGTPNGISARSMPQRALAAGHAQVAALFDKEGPSGAEWVQALHVSSSAAVHGNRLTRAKAAARSSLLPALVQYLTPGWAGPTYKSLDGLQSALMLLFVGRFERLKGTDTLEAVAAWACEHGHVLFVAGERSEDATGWKDFVEMHDRYASAQGSHTCAGWVISLPDRQSQAVLLPLMRAAADVAIVPSQMEAFGFVALEALAHSSVVVASNVGGLPDMVSSGISTDRLRGIGSGSSARGQEGQPQLDIHTAALWTGTLFTRTLDSVASSANLVAALQQTVQRLQALGPQQRDTHLAVLQAVANTYSWGQQGEHTVMSRWDTVYARAWAHAAGLYRHSHMGQAQ